MPRPHLGDSKKKGTHAMLVLVPLAVVGVLSFGAVILVNKLKKH